MINDFKLGGRIVSFVVDEYGGTLTVEVQPPKSSPYNVTIKVFKDKAVAAQSALIAGSPILVFGTIYARQGKDGRWWNDLTCQEYFLPAGRGSKATPITPHPQPEQDNDFPF